MHKHEEKNCPRCQSLFECKAGNIGHCQCYGIMMSEEERSRVENSYQDCLCRDCLVELATTHDTNHSVEKSHR